MNVLNKRFFSLVMGLVFTFSLLLVKPITVSAATIIELVNSGFEGNYNTIESIPTITGEIAEGWREDSSWMGSTIKYSKDNLVRHSGDSSLKIQLADKGLQLAQTVNFSSNKVYTFTMWVKGEQGKRINIGIRKKDAPWTTYSASTVVCTGEWQKASVSTNTLDVEGIVVVSASDVGTFYIDDAQLEITSDLKNYDLPKGKISSDFFGMHIADFDKIPWPTVNFKMLRTWDSGIYWSAMEPKKGEWKFEKLDQLVSLAATHGSKVTLTLGQTPEWAASRLTANDEWYMGHGSASEPKDIQDWRDYITTIATRYKGKIAIYEPWNEPNGAGFYSGTVEKMVELSKEAYTIIKSIDSKAIVTNPPVYDPSYLDEFLSKGGKNYIDAVAYHFYAAVPAESDANIKLIRMIMEKNGLKNKPLINSEAGTGGNLKGEPDIVAAGYVARQYIINWINGVSLFNWYQWDNPWEGIMTPMVKKDGVRITASAVGYQNIQKWLIGSRVKSKVVTADNNWIIELTGTNNKRAWILWNPSNKVTFDIPKEWNANFVENILGKITPLRKSQSVLVQADPILITSEDLSGNDIKLLLNVDNNTIYGGTSTNLILTAMDKNGCSVDLSKAKISYSSSNPLTATVDPINGRVSGINSGATIITANVELYSKQIKTIQIGIIVNDIDNLELKPVISTVD